MSATRQPVLADQITDAARVLGQRGGRPRGSYSPLGLWLRAEIRQRRREGYRAREAFCILRDTERPSGADAFLVTDHTADAYGLDIGARVSWDWFKKTWGTETAKYPLRP